MEERLRALSAADPSERLSAVQQLKSGSSAAPEVITRVEHIALADPDPGVRAAAQAALESPALRQGRAGLAAAQPGGALPARLRSEIALQVTRWLFAGRLRPEQASVIRARYAFDFSVPPINEASSRALLEEIRTWQQDGLLEGPQAAALLEEIQFTLPAPLQAAPAKEPRPARPDNVQSPIPPATSGPRPSLLDVLFSEVSIRISLYLGGFLVAAAALIFATLVAAARLPVLLVLTAASGAGALLLRKRLPLPGVVLFLLFAALLPIDARLVADLQHLPDGPRQLFWTVTWTLEAAVIALGALAYRSRLLAVAAPFLLDLSAVELANTLNFQFPAAASETDALLAALYAVLLGLAALVGVGWMAFLKRRPGLLSSGTADAQLPAESTTQPSNRKVARPVPLALPVLNGAQMGLTLGWSLALLLAYAMDFYHPSPLARWLLLSSWTIGMLVFLLSDFQLERFLLYPPLAAGAAAFLPYSLLWALDVAHPAIWMGAAALLFLAAGTLLLRPRPAGMWARYGSWLLCAAGFVWAWGAFMYASVLVDSPLYLLLWAAALTLAALALRQRVYAPKILWSAALLAALMGYFQLFEEPWLQHVHIAQIIMMLVAALIALLPDLFLRPDLGHAKGWRWPPRMLGISLFAATVTLAVDGEQALPTLIAVLVLAAYALAAGLRYRRPYCGYFMTGLALLALTVWLRWQQVPAWMLPISALGMLFYAVGTGLRRAWSSPRWSLVLRLSGLGTGLLVLLRMAFEHGGAPGFGLQVGALLLAAALYLAKRLEQRAPGTAQVSLGLGTAWLLLEAGLAALLCAALAAGMGTEKWTDLKGFEWLVGSALLSLILDLAFTRLDGPFPARWTLRAVGAGLALWAALFALAASPHAGIVAGGLGLLGLFFVAAGLLYPEPRLAAAATAYLALALAWVLRWQLQPAWSLPLMGLAVVGYALGFAIGRYLSPAGEASLLDLLRPVRWQAPRTAGWAGAMRYAALALALVVALSAPYEDRLSSSVAVAAAATLFAVEAWRRRNVWLGFPANGLYLLAYFIVLYQVKVSEPQYYSCGVAALGLVMHYLLVRTGKRTGAFLTGMVSQLALLGTTYIQMFATQKLSFFFVLFFQGLAVLIYGILIRSRSLVIAPLGFIIIGVLTVVIKFLSVLPTVMVIGCTGFVLLALGILAVVMRERLMQAGQSIGERLGGWQA
jgi:hypothetical protein